MAEGKAAGAGNVGGRAVNPCPGFGRVLYRLVGVIDTGLNEFQTQNNDGGRDVNEPYVFRRVSCFPDGSEFHPQIVTEPPDFYPNQGGCGCDF